MREQLHHKWNNDHWATPPAFVAQLEARYGAFQLDPCATRATAKAPRFYTPRQNGLLRPWDGRVFLNPPYSEVLPWVERAARLTRRGRCPLVIALLPPCVDTGWWHDWVLPYAQILWVRGRIHFLGENGKPAKATRSPNVVAVYEGPHVAPGQTLWTRASILEANP